MYTELIFGCSLKRDTPVIAINTLLWMCGKKDKPEALPNHSFFNDEENRKFIFQSGSFYFGINKGVSEMWLDKIDNAWRISARGNIKNYNQEIEQFLDWVKQYVAAGSGNREFYAIVCYEEQDVPTIYYLED